MKDRPRFASRTPDFLDIPYVFTQQDLLSPDSFCREAQERGVELELGHLEALSSSGRLIPLYHLPPPPSRLKKLLVHSGGDSALENLTLLRDLGLLADPREHTLRSWWRLKEPGISSWRTGLRYSPFQLLALPTIRRLLPLMRQRRGRSPFNLRLDWGPKAYPRPLLPPGEIVPLNLLAALHLADTVYLQSIVKGIRHSGDAKSFDAYLQYVERFNPKLLVEWLGQDAAWILAQAEQLTIQAGGVDPNRAWIDLIRLVRPEKWAELKGSARSALDFRIASECLNRLYDDLVRRRAAPRRMNVPKFAWHPSRERLRDDRQDLDPVLTDYGLSPHPAVVLVVEGHSEELLFHRMMSHLKLPYHRSRVEIFNAGGDAKNFNLLASFAAVPELGERLPGHRFVLLRRPLTRYIVILDASQRQDLAGLQETSTNAILEQLPKRYQTPKAREELEGIVTVETWGGYGGSMEYANFTDAEIVAAVARLCAERGVTIPPLESRIAEAE